VFKLTRQTKTNRRDEEDEVDEERRKREREREREREKETEKGVGDYYALTYAHHVCVGPVRRECISCTPRSC